MNYKGYIDWKKWSEEDFGLLTPGSRFSFDQTFKKKLKVSSKILEIGFGNGELLSYFRDKGHQVVGVEVNGALVRRALNSQYAAYLGAVSEIPELQFEKFDLIVAFSVAEHMSYEDLNALFSWTKKHLNHGGLLYLKFPEGGSPLALAYQNGDFTHVTCLTKSKIKSLCNESDMELVSYTDEHLVSNKLCGFGLIGRMCLMMLQWYGNLLKWTIKLLLFPLCPSLKLGTNSIAVIKAN
jgi:SAM-dependent methyltransferase